MKFPWPIMVISLVIWGSDMSWGSDSHRQLVRIDLSGQRWENIQEFLSLQPDITSYGRDGRTVDVLTTVTTRERITWLGLPAEVLIEDADAYEEMLRSQDYFDHFTTYAQMVAEMRQVAESHPGVAAIYDIGDSWEKTQGIADRDIWALKISDNVSTEEPQEAEILYTACHHAREIITPEIVLFLMHYLIDGYGSDSEATYLVDNRQLWLVPMVNPDGHEYVFDQDMWWRKNRRRNNDGSYGIDLNRNYGYMWGYDNVGSSPIPQSEIYRGLAPFSEPETQAIRDLAEAHTFVISLCYHSYGNLFLFPWGYAPLNTLDHESFVAIGEGATMHNGYFSGNNKMGAIYGTNGSSDDWLYGEQITKYKILAYTPEVGGDQDGFHPDTSRIMPLIEENLGPNLHVARVAERYAPRPQVRHMPLKDTEDAAGPYLVRAEIISPAYPLDMSSPTVHFNTSGVFPFDSLAMTYSGVEDLFEAQIPSLGENVTIYYFISAGDVVPRVGYAPQTAPDSLYAFRVGSDHVPPEISHEARHRLSARHRPLRIEATVQDNLGISRVEVAYSMNNGPLHTTGMSTAGSDLYQGTIDWDAPLAGDWIAYAIVAMDQSVQANISRHPEFGFHYLLLTDDLVFTFEDDENGFSTDPESDWELGIPASGPLAAYSGQKVWGTRLGGSYSDLSDSRLDAPPIDLAGYAAAKLVFAHWYETESLYGTVLDGGNVKLSADGASFQVIVPEGGYDEYAILPTLENPLVGEPAFGGYSPAGDFWHQDAFDLSSYIDQSVIIRFHFGSNETVTAAGWYIDDVEVRLSASRNPQFAGAILPADTSDAEGPYLVTVSILDDSQVEEAWIYYRRHESEPFQTLPMDRLIPFLFQGGIPGQQPQTRVEFYLAAEDDSGNVALYPQGAPDTTFSFTISGTAVNDPEAASSSLPEHPGLCQNYPNPFNSATSITYQMPRNEFQRPAHVTLRIFNTLGQQIRTLVDEWKGPGYYTAIWDGKDQMGQNVGSGVYLYHFETGELRETRNMVLLR